MSTICKLDPQVRLDRAARRNLLRNPPRATHKGHAILAELAIIKRASHLTGETKDALFRRGAYQLTRGT